MQSIVQIGPESIIDDDEKAIVRFNIGLRLSQNPILVTLALNYLSGLILLLFLAEASSLDCFGVRS
jgi:hypothetical protein